jgi:hypothetical protein
VPKILLRGFAEGAREQIFAFDKWNNRPFKTSIRNVAGQSAFYDLETPDGLATLEPALSQLESATAPLLERVRSDKSINFLTKDDRIQLALFAMVQHQRTQGNRARFAQMSADFATWLRKLGFDPGQVKNFKELDEEGAKVVGLQLVAGAHELVPYILGKSWVLLHASPKDQFYIGDNPVALKNLKTFGFYGNIGLGVPGIEIYLPVSTDLTLAWYSDSFVTEFAQAIENANTLRQQMPSRIAEIEKLVQMPQAFLAAVSTGTALNCSADNVVNMNAMQVRFAERFVYSRVDDFDLVRQMLSDDPRYRTGPRIQVG